LRGLREDGAGQPCQAEKNKQRNHTSHHATSTTDHGYRDDELDVRNVQ
jgi:hypothetical protein